MKTAKAYSMKQPPVVVDTLLILSPPTGLAEWIGKVFAAKRAKGETIPPAYEIWLKRWADIRDGLTTEVSVLTAEEWQAIKAYLETKVTT